MINASEDSSADIYRNIKGIIVLLQYCWVFGIYEYGHYPMLSWILFLGAASATTVNYFTNINVVGASASSLLSTIAYAVLITGEIAGLRDTYEISHLLCNAFLLGGSFHSFATLSSIVKSIEVCHKRIAVVEGVSHTIGAVFNPLYILLITVDILEYIMHRKQKINATPLNHK